MEIKLVEWWEIPQFSTTNMLKSTQVQARDWNVENVRNVIELEYQRTHTLFH